MTVSLITLGVVAAIAIITLLGLAALAYSNAENARSNGYDQGYDDAKRGHDLRIDDLQHEIEHLHLKAANQRAAHQLERDAIIQDADARIAIYASRALTAGDIHTLRIANKQLLAAAKTYSEFPLANLADQARFALKVAGQIEQLAQRLEGINSQAAAQEAAA